MSKTTIHKELQSQFADQLKCFEFRCDVDSIVLGQMQDFYRRLAGAQQDYADALVKVTNGVRQRYNNEKNKHPNFPTYSLSTVWNEAIESTVKVSQAHVAYSEACSKQITRRLIDISEDCSRLHKHCRDLMTSCQDRLLGLVAKLQQAHRQYTVKQQVESECLRVARKAEDKLVLLRAKLEDKGKEVSSNKKFQLADQDLGQKTKSHNAARLELTRARNEYLLQLAVTNHGISQYFKQELSDIVECMVCGFHNSVSRSMMTHMRCEKELAACHTKISQILDRNRAKLNMREDKKLFFKLNQQVLATPAYFVFQPAKDDSESNIQIENDLREEIDKMIEELKTKRQKLNISTEESCKLLIHSEIGLLELINLTDYEVTRLFCKDSKGATIDRRMTAATITSDQTPSVLASIASSSVGASNELVASATLPSPGMGRKSSSTDQLSVVPPTSDLLYTDMRGRYRSTRIEQESKYIEELDNLQQTDVLLDELQKALAEIDASNGLITSSTKAYAANVGVGVLPKVKSIDNLDIPTSARDDGDKRFRQIFSPSGNKKFDFTALSPSPSKPAIDRQTIDKPSSPRRHPVLQVPVMDRPPLFGGTIDKYVRVSGQKIPPFILTCTRELVERGMSQQGLFRVSGNQREINELKEAFEAGDDPLSDSGENHYEIHSIASLFKLYFRELAEPVFPPSIFDDLLACAQYDQDETARQLCALLTRSLSNPVFVVLRFLFDFLNHFSQFAETTKMNAANLSICFGPTLLPIPPTHNPIEHHNTINTLIQVMITHHNIVFDRMRPGPVYSTTTTTNRATTPGGSAMTPSSGQPIQHQLMLSSTCLVSDLETKYRERLARTSGLHTPTDVADGGGSMQQTGSNNDNDIVKVPVESPRRCQPPLVDDSGQGHEEDDECEDEDGLGASSDDPLYTSDSEDSMSSDSNVVVALAQADYVAKSSRELSIHQGQEVVLLRRLDPHWWEGRLTMTTGDDDQQGTCQRGLVPDIYVIPKQSLLQTQSPIQLASPSQVPIVSQASAIEPPLVVPLSPRLEQSTPSSATINQDQDSFSQSPTVDKTSDKLTEAIDDNSALLDARHDSLSLSSPRRQSSSASSTNPCGGVDDDATSPKARSPTDNNHDSPAVPANDDDKDREEIGYEFELHKEQSQRDHRQQRLSMANYKPDLVMDLPPSSPDNGDELTSPPSSRQHSLSPPAASTTSEQFAEQGLSTVRKRPDPTSPPIVAATVSSGNKPAVPPEKPTVPKPVRPHIVEFRKSSTLSVEPTDEREPPTAIKSFAERMKMFESGSKASPNPPPVKRKPLL